MSIERSPFEVSDAVSQISAIHEHLVKGEIYRGYRPLPIAVSGIVGLAAAAVQGKFLPEVTSSRYLVYWVAVGAICAVISASEIVYNYLFADTAYDKRCTRRVLGQFLPCLVAGCLMTAVVMSARPEFASVLPGTWALFFGLGIFASRPYLPHATGWLALYYFVLGTWLLFTMGQAPLSGWRVGGVFGGGQLLAGLVLYWNVERRQREI
ncbi:MAG: hypothetical protein K1X53_12095 [Candidatus Sumerlaeaceae bacterium]|nr:hypothetical protein [Candidatus Sumerlaeaceae bacterium]